MSSREKTNLMLRAILERGIQVDPAGIDHKHNEQIAGAPRSPIKLNLCTPELRAAGRLTEADMQLIAECMADYLQVQNLRPPAIAGIPRVGEKLAVLLQQVLQKQNIDVPLIRATKIDNADGTRRIGPVTPNPDYLSGPLWLIDDLVNWGYSKREAVARFTEAGYRVTDSLVAIDYAVGAGALLHGMGIRLHTLATLEQLLERATEEHSLDADIIAKTRAYLQASRTANASQT